MTISRFRRYPVKLCAFIALVVCGGCSNRFAIECDTTASAAWTEVGESVSVGNDFKTLFIIDEGRETVTAVAKGLTEDPMEAVITTGSIVANKIVKQTVIELKIDRIDGVGEQRISNLQGVFSERYRSCQKTDVPDIDSTEPRF
jgi:hypothetical protein